MAGPWLCGPWSKASVCKDFHYFSMTIELAVDFFRQLILTSLLLVAPTLLTTIGVGLVVSLIQSVTSIQEQTLTFVPKLLAVAAVLLVTSHWMVRTLMEFCTTFIQRIPDMAP